MTLGGKGLCRLLHQCSQKGKFPNNKREICPLFISIWPKDPVVYLIDKYVCYKVERKGLRNKKGEPPMTELNQIVLNQIELFLA